MTDWLGTWKYRIPITIDAGDIDADLANFPLLLYISADSGISSDDITAIFDELGANKLKIAVTTDDGTTQCYVEIDEWDNSNEKAWLWVKVPAIDDTNNTILYLYFDSTQSDNTDYIGVVQSTPAQAVWDANFKAIHHLAETSSPSRDSKNAHDLTWFNQTDDTTGKIGKGHIYDGTDDSESRTTNTIGLSTAWTWEFWFKATNLTQTNKYVMQLMKKTNGSGNQFAVLWEFVNNTIEMYCNVVDFRTGSQLPLSDTNWHHIVYRYDGSNLYGYVDGVQIVNPAKSGLTVPDVSHYYALACSVGYDLNKYNFCGCTLDEVRISNIARSAAWVKATYQTEIDDLIEWGTIEEYEVGGVNYEREVSDIIGGLEVRIQSVSINKIDIIGEVEVKVKNVSKFLSDIIGLSHSENIIVDYYNDASLDEVYILRQHPSNDSGISARGQTFKLTDSYLLHSVKFKLKRTSPAPTGTLKAYLYAHSGEFGSTGIPTGDPLAVSISIDMSNMPTTYTWIEFTFDDIFTLEANVPYCIVIYSLDGNLDGSHYLGMMGKNAGMDDGNGIYYNNNVFWDWHTTRDNYFYLYGSVSFFTAIVSYFRIFTESIGEIENKIKNIVKILSDKIGSLESKVRTVNLHRIFSDIIGNKDILSFARILERTLIEILGMVESHTGIRHYIRVFLEKTGMKHKYSNLKNWYTYWHKERPRQRVSSE